MPDYTIIDRSPVLRYVFYPRNDYTPCPAGAFDVTVPVDNDVLISCRFYVGNDVWPWILFFHGNGEVVSDYDYIAPLYQKNGLNLVVADYRGYGASNGMPSLTNLFRDAHVIFLKIKKELESRHYNNRLWVMGRSLGSLSALELGYHHKDEIKGIIIESGFANILRILIHLDLPVHDIDVEGIDQACLEMVRKISLPTLIIHGEKDILVPLKEAETLYNHIGAISKRLVVISGADHNDIMPVGIEQYFTAIRQFVSNG